MAKTNYRMEAQKGENNHRKVSHTGVNLILDTSLRFQLIFTKPLKNYLRLFSIVILGVESDSEVKLIL